MSSNLKKIFLTGFLFLTVFLIFAIAGIGVWFQADDVGNIVGGIIKNFSDFVRVFTEDERIYIYPMNFTIPKPNLVSGFYRPLQHIPFTIIYYFFGFNPYAYYLTNVFFHALNSVLFFYFCSLFFSLNIAFLGGLLLAFYPFYDWIAWLSCLHNFLAIFFMILSFIFYRSFWLTRKTSFQVIAASMFFLSIISRENTIVLGFWIFLGTFLFCNNCNIWERIKSVFINSWAFFITYLIYFLIKLYSFGYQSLDRTFNNFLLKVPYLRTVFSNKSTHISVKNVAKKIYEIIETGFSKINNFTLLDKSTDSFLDRLSNKFTFLFDKIERWFDVIFNISFKNNFNKILILVLFVFILYSYRRYKKVLFFLISGVILFSWPGVVAYPNPRYVSAIYPFLIFIFLLSIYLFKKEQIGSLKKYTILLIVLLFAYLSVFTEMDRNVRAIKHLVVNGQDYKVKFETFFKENSFEKNAKFIVLGSPFVSDIHNIFQMFLSDLDLKLACVRISTLAERGSMGCRGDYKSKGVRSKINPVVVDNKHGYRLISLDKNHCGWWMNLSHFPLRWSEKDRSYVWDDKIPEIGTWYDFSMGKFIINERLDDKYIIDVTFVFDDKWIDKNTVFVIWDTMDGQYKVLK